MKELDLLKLLLPKELPEYFTLTKSTKSDSGYIVKPEKGLFF